MAKTAETAIKSRKRRNKKGDVANQQTKSRMARQEIVAKLYKRGFTEVQIRCAVMQELGLKTYSGQTVHADVVAIRKMWQDEVIDDVDYLIRLELKRIDDCIKEAWEAWEKSKTDYKYKENRQKGVVSNGMTTPPVREITQKETEERCYGDPRYLAEIRKQLAERRKLLGLYAPEKKEITSNLMDLSALTDGELITYYEITKKARAQ